MLVVRIGQGTVVVLEVLAGQRCSFSYCIKLTCIADVFDETKATTA